MESAAVSEQHTSPYKIMPVGGAMSGSPDSIFARWQLSCHTLTHSQGYGGLKKEILNNS